MRVEFKNNPAADIALMILVFTAIPAIFIAPFLPAYAIVIIVVIAALLVMICALMASCRGVISAEEKEIFIFYLFYGRRIREKSIAYSDIDSVKCDLNRYQFKGRLHYILKFQMDIKDGRTFSTSEGVGRVSDLSPYDKAITEHPLRKLYDYINERIETSV